MAVNQTPFTIRFYQLFDYPSFDFACTERYQLEPLDIISKIYTWNVNDKSYLIGNASDAHRNTILFLCWAFSVRESQVQITNIRMIRNGS